MTSSVPARRWILGGGLIALGVCSGLGVLVYSIFSLFGSLLRIDVPGSGELRLDRGGYSVYYESPALAKKYSQVPALTVAIEAKDGGDAVPVSDDILIPIRYSALSRWGALSAEFRIDRPGDYRVTVSAPLLKQAAPANISIARGLGGWGITRLTLLPFALLSGGIGAGLFILLRRPKSA